MSTRQEMESFQNSDRVTGRAPVKPSKYIFITFIILVFAVYCGLRAGAYSEATGETAAFAALYGALQTFSFDFVYNKVALTAGGFVFAILGVIVLFTELDKITYSHYNSETSHGSEHFMTKKEIAVFNRTMNEPAGKPVSNDSRNMILSQNIQLSLNTKMTQMNNNVLVIGGPGSGKSWRLVKPNLLQGNTSFVVTDPSGELLRTTGRFFESIGYQIKVFNLDDMSHSDCYNPFWYANNEENALSMVDSLIYATRDEGKSGGDPFWEDSMRSLLLALVFYLKSFAPPSKQNFHQVAQMLRGADSEDKGQKKKSDLDMIIDGVRQKDPDHICVKYYDIFLKAGDKTAASILVTTAVKLAPFNLEAIANLTSTDDMDVGTIGDKKTIVFIIVKQGTKTSNSFLVNMFYTSIFSSLYFHAMNDKVMCPNGRLKYDVQFILDEFANIGVIPSFEAKLSTMRKFGLSCWIIIQAIAQVKSLYDKQWETIVGDCSTIIYLGSDEQAAMEDINKRLGKRTVKLEDRSYSSQTNKSGSSSKSYKYSERDLMTISEIRRLDKKYCIVIMEGQHAVLDLKYDTTHHPNAAEMGNDADGSRLYLFSKCNIKPKALTTYIERKKKRDEQMIAACIAKRMITRPVNVGNEVDVSVEDPAVKEVTGGYAQCQKDSPSGNYVKQRRPMTAEERKASPLPKIVNSKRK